MSEAFAPFSPKQLQALTFWCPGSGAQRYDAVICDGAVRSGKTFCISLSFVLWATWSFRDRSFAICGKTVTSLRRNIILPLLSTLTSLGFSCQHKLSQNCVTVTKGDVTNRFFLFGGKDESSASLIQGMTLAGVLFDEVVLMPRSFVEQALARCSVDGSKFFFSCNPGNPRHWFHTEWIENAGNKNAMYLHFTMEDNPSLSPAIRRRYRRLYTGVFYKRFIEGAWVAADGLIYPMFSMECHGTDPSDRVFERWYLSCDYGTVNPSSFGLWGQSGQEYVRVDEYYFDSRAQGFSRTDEEHYRALEALAGGREISFVVVDPSAASFIECIRRHGRFSVIPAKNDVIDGIRKVSDALVSRKILFSRLCRHTFEEFSLYSWDENSKKDAPKKVSDHAMDDIRYFVSTVVYSTREEDCFAIAVER